jgi:molybdate transport system ATP-binding protein
MNTSLLSIQNITVRYLDQTIFKDLSFQINKGEHWALVGESGSGKSALLQTISGKFNVVGGAVHHYYFEDLLKQKSDSNAHLTHHKLIAIVSSKHGFRNLSNTTDFYYQQRFNSSDSEDAPTVEAYLSGIEPVSHAHQFWTK